MQCDAWPRLWRALLRALECRDIVRAIAPLLARQRWFRTSAIARHYRLWAEEEEEGGGDVIVDLWDTK